MYVVTGTRYKTMFRKGVEKKMKSRKRIYGVGLSIVFFSILGISLFNNDTQIKAFEEKVAEDKQTIATDSSYLPKTAADLHKQETITVPQMEAYLEGTNYHNVNDNEENITGSMTKEQYQLQYSELNAQQNAEWNAQYNFRPETKVVHVSNYAEFKKAYADNTVSKIVLDDDAITTETNERTERKESIEIDGQGHLLQVASGGFNVINGTTNSFSDTPVFHMHDIQIINGPVGEEGGANAYSWSFINGDGQSLGAAGANRAKWHYRVGNIYTPYDSSLKDENHRIRGRLIGANRAEVSMWGHNTIVTGAENFYVGSFKVEPNTWYRGMVGHYNYSVIWFMENTKTDGTETGADRSFDIGEGSFVYLKNQKNTADSYPAVYGFFDNINIKEGATYNANMAGNAARFNISNSTFTAHEGATVNLLSRSTSIATVGYGGLATNLGSEGNPSNLKYEFMPNSNVFIVGGSNTNSVIDMNSSSGSNFEFILDSPESFDIRNTTTAANKSFLADSGSNRGTKSFIIKNSDISIWNKTGDMDGSPTYDYSNVQEMKVTNKVAAGEVTSTDTDLASQYSRANFKRISGMNTIPELTWVPVTDADLNQRGQVLLGFTAVGGSDPFDENGNAKVKPVYADSVRKVYVDFTDTLGNTYTGISADDTYVHWDEIDHKLPDFQLAQQNMFGTPYRATNVNNVLTPYRIGEKKETEVIDITPPEPAQVTGGKVTNGTKQLIGKDAEPKAKIYVEINGIRQTTVGMVNDDGTWIYNLPRYLETGETVQIFLEDNAEKITEELDPAVPTTNTETGNINPAVEMKYRDATFKAAAKYTVEDVLPDNPIMKKEVISTGGKTTQVGDILTYTLTATNGKDAKLDAVWKNVTVRDTIPAGLAFNLEKANITINGTEAAKEDYTYDTQSRLLIVKVGDLGAGDSVIVTFQTEVEQSAVGKIITNVGTATGLSPRELGEFIEGPDDPEQAHEVFAENASVVNPGGSIFGILELVSAPKVINFGSTEFSPNGTKITNPSYEGGDLIVKDGRAVQETWTLNARLEKELANIEAPDKFIPRAIRYVSNNKEITLMGASQPIESRKNENSDPYNISGTWSPDGDGFKLKVDSGQAIEAGKYEATIIWELVTGPPSANP